jgi:uncharacterized repeat protein (TIGR01451 family)
MYSLILEIDKQGPSKVDTGADFTYTLTVTNNGPDDATNVIVTDNLPDKVTYRHRHRPRPGKRECRYIVLGNRQPARWSFGEHDGARYRSCNRQCDTEWGHSYRDQKDQIWKTTSI